MAQSSGLKTVDFLTKQLITAVTGLEEGDENFDRSFEYVSSNFKFHKFLDVDSHKVTRTVNGIHEKFLVHCQDKKATDFRQLCDEFLNTSAFEGRDHGRTDTHFAILFTLLLLANSPTNVEYQPVAKSKKHDDEEEKFDWTAYLLEGEDVIPRHFASDSPTISDDDEDETVPYDQKEIEPFRNASIIVPDTCGDVKVVPGTAEFNTAAQPISSVQDWLRQNVIVQYWKGETETRPHALCRFSNVSVDWESYLMRTSSIYVPSTKSVVTEYHIAREIIWMLCGVRDLFVFQWNGKKFVPNADIRVSHLTDDALQTLLARVVCYGDIVQKLKQFITDTLTPVPSNATTCVTRTYQSFASALSDHLSLFSTQLVDLETKVCKQDDTITLSRVLDGLSFSFRELDMLDQIYTSGVMASCHVTSASGKASNLLKEIFQTLIDLSHLGDDSCTLVSMVLLLWIKTSRPYIDIIDSWITHGHLNDTCGEFIVRRNDAVKSPNENFWNEAFSLSGAGHAAVPCQQAEQHDEQPDPGPYIPGFLQPIIKEVIVAGKSMELLHSLGHCSDITRNVIAQRKQTLYEAYTTSLCRHFIKAADGLSDSRKDGSLVDNTLAESPHSFVGEVEHLLRQSATYDPLLAVNFRHLIAFGSSVQSSNQSDSLDRRLHHTVLSSLEPLQTALHSSLQQQIASQCVLVNTHLLRVLTDTYCLMHYFTAIRHFYLMEAGRQMSEFYTAVFDKMNAREVWQDVSFLNGALHDALSSEYRSDMESIFVSVDTEKSKTASKASSTMDCISLQYRVPWPVDIILNSRCMSFYNEVFRFLLHIKRAKYSLDGLKFVVLQETCRNFAKTDAPLTSAKFLQSTVSQGRLGNMETVSESHTETLVHRTQIFRMRLVHFVNSLHDYVMTRILHSVGLEFQASASAARDLDELILAHRTYISTIRERCLLHPKVSFIRETISNVLNQALVIHQLWNNMIATQLSHSKLEEMENEFRQCLRFLSSMINKVTARGSFPHLESLAFSLVTCSQIPQPNSR